MIVPLLLDLYPLRRNLREDWIETWLGGEGDLKFDSEFPASPGHFQNPFCDGGISTPGIYPPASPPGIFLEVSVVLVGTIIIVGI